MIRRPPRSTRTDTLVPYTTLFRSAETGFGGRNRRGALPARQPDDRTGADDRLARGPLRYRSGKFVRIAARRPLTTRASGSRASRGLRRPRNPSARWRGLQAFPEQRQRLLGEPPHVRRAVVAAGLERAHPRDRKSTRLHSSP